MAPNYEGASMFSVKGLVVVITGGGSGLGANVAHALDANGAKAVYILGRRKEALDRTISAGTNGSIKGIVCDVTSKDQLKKAADQITSEVGYINVLFANSGIIGPGTGGVLGQAEPPSIDTFVDTLWKTDMAEFTNAMHVNVTGVFFTSLAFAKLLAKGNETDKHRKSSILVTSSIAAFTRTPFAGYAYSSSKSAVTHLVKQLSTTLAPYKIRCNALAPGFFPSEMTENMPWNKTGKDPREEGNVDAKLVPLERTGTEEDIAGTALWLMSPAGAYMNGSIQVIDGGRIGIQPATY